MRVKMRIASVATALLLSIFSISGCAPNKISSSALRQNEDIKGVLVINTAFGSEDFKAGLKSELAKCGAGVTFIANDEVHGKDKAFVASLLRRRGAEMDAGHLLEIYWSSSSRTVGSSAGSSHYTLGITRIADGASVWKATDTIRTGIFREKAQYGAIAADIVKKIREDRVIAACG